MIEIDGNSLTIQEVVSVSKARERVTLAERALRAIQESRDFVEKLFKEGRAVYGVTTGVGELAQRVVSTSDLERLQLNLVRSHATGVGEPLDEDIVRATMLLRANALAKGYSGVRQELITFLLELLNRDVYPYIPSRGSVGASGDLVPLAHLALVIVGEGECLRDGKRQPSSAALEAVGLAPMTLASKEGLALTNRSDAIADWPLLNALANAVCGADWVSIHNGGGVGIGNSTHTGQVIVATGKKEKRIRLERVLTADPMTGIFRHADAGYEEAIDFAKSRQVNIPGLKEN